MIRRSYEAFFWIKKVRQFGGGYETFPAVIAASGDRQEAGPATNRCEAGGMLTDVARIVGINNIFGRNFSAPDRRFELVPVLGPINRQ